MENKVFTEDLTYILKNLDKPELYRGSKILVTGCGGFLGYYFLQFFVKNAETLGIRQVIGLDTFILGKPSWIEDLQDQNPNVFKLHTFDVVKDDISAIPGASDANFVLHMASIASPVFYRMYPIETIDANIWGLRKLLDFYCGKSLQSFLFFSSSEIYGDPPADQIPTSEEYRGNVAPIGPRACYDEAKRFGETVCYLFAEKHKLPIGICRPFNAFGPGMRSDDQRVTADFADAVLNNKQIRILSDGTPTRTFCYVSDAIVGYLKVLTYGKFDVFNIGSEKPELSMRDLADIYKRIGSELYGFTQDIVFAKSTDAHYLTDNPKRRCPDLEKARRLLNFRPMISVEEGVARALEYLAFEKRHQ